MKIMKNLGLTVLVLVLSLSLAGCGFVHFFGALKSGKEGNDLNAVTAITGTMTAEEFVDEQGDSFLYGLEYGFEKSSGMECDSKMEARGNDLKVWIYLEGIDNVPVSEKRQLQESYNESKDSIREGFSLVETLVPAIDTITLYVCEEDGDILAPIELEY